MRAFATTSSTSGTSSSLLRQAARQLEVQLLPIYRYFIFSIILEMFASRFSIDTFTLFYLFHLFFVQYKVVTTAATMFA
jgi:hypothetical protein